MVHGKHGKLHVGQEEQATPECQVDAAQTLHFERGSLFFSFRFAERKNNARVQIGPANMVDIFHSSHNYDFDILAGAILCLVGAGIVIFVCVACALLARLQFGD